MALRDFDRVRERIVLRLEIRHLVQFGLVVLILAAGCFGLGYRIGETSGLVTVPVHKAAVVQGSDTPPLVVLAAPGPVPLAETPVVPKPLAPIPAPLLIAPDAVLKALTVQDRESVAATGERELVAESADAPALPAAAIDAPVPAVEVPVAAVETPAAAVEEPVAPWPPIGFLRSSVGAPAPKPEVTAQARPHTKPAHVAPAAPATPGPPPRAVAVTERFVVQVKAFRNEAEAQAFQAQLQARGHHTTLSTIDVPDKGTFFRIRLGPFPTVEQAKAAQRKFEQAEGHATMILVVGLAPAPASPEP